MIERTKALAEKAERDMGLLSFHQKVYELLSLEDGDGIKAEALNKVELWKKDNLCIRYYIETWEAIIKNGLAMFHEKILSSESRESLALMQNSPFSFLMRENFNRHDNALIP